MLQPGLDAAAWMRREYQSIAEAELQQPRYGEDFAQEETGDAAKSRLEPSLSGAVIQRMNCIVLCRREPGIWTRLPFAASVAILVLACKGGL